MRTSFDWQNYFEENAHSLLNIPWDAGHELTEYEQRAISSSVQDFQAGESSEGRHLIQYAKQYARQSGDYEYIEAIRLFIAEEQRHARDLAHFLQINRIPLVKTTFSNRVFRRLRQSLGNLESSITVLITAEIIAKVYYAALKEATGSVVLQQLCKQIIQDEVKHVEFQAERLGLLRANRNRTLLKATVTLQRFLFLGTCIVVWLFHHKVFRKGGYNLSRYWQQNWKEYENTLELTHNVIDALAAKSEIPDWKENYSRE